MSRRRAPDSDVREDEAVEGSRDRDQNAAGGEGNEPRGRGRPLEPEALGQVQEAQGQQAHQGDEHTVNQPVHAGLLVGARHDRGGAAVRDRMVQDHHQGQDGGETDDGACKEVREGAG